MNEKYYRDFNFCGSFFVNVSSTEHIRIINKGGPIESNLFWNKEVCAYEPETLWFWIKACKQAIVILDIGANIGLYSLIAKVNNPDAHIIAFEPARKTFKDLLDNVRVNNFDIVCKEIALSDKSGVATFYDTFERCQLSASLSSKKLKELEGCDIPISEYEVQTQTLSDFIGSNGIERIDLMKIDVELYESEVLQGMGAYLSEYKPIIVIEVLANDVGKRVHDIVVPIGYEIFHLEKENVLKKESKFDVYGKADNFALIHRDSEFVKHTR